MDEYSAESRRQLGKQLLEDQEVMDELALKAAADDKQLSELQSKRLRLLRDMQAVSDNKGVVEQKK